MTAILQQVAIDHKEYVSLKIFIGIRIGRNNPEEVQVRRGVRAGGILSTNI